jgi:hypothetical protein
MKPSVIAVLALACAVSVLGCAGASLPASPSPTSGSLPPDGPISTDAPSDMPGAAPPLGQPTLVIPKPGQRNVHDVAIEQLSARVAGRHVVLNARWWSGVEPCSVLDSIAVSRTAQTITVAVREGSGPGEVACIDIAMLKVTAIDLGDLEPGDYTVVASQGSAPGVAVTVG